MFDPRGTPAVCNEQTMHLLWPAWTLFRLLPGYAKSTNSSVEEGALVSQTSSISSSLICINLPASFQWLHKSLLIHVFVDSSTDDSFIHSALVEQASPLKSSMPSRR